MHYDSKMEELGRNTGFSQKTEKAEKGQFVDTSLNTKGFRKIFAICLSSVTFDLEMCVI